MKQVQQAQALIVVLLLVLLALLTQANGENGRQTNQLQLNSQTLRNIEHHTRATAKSVEAMCRDAVTPPSAC